MLEEPLDNERKPPDTEDNTTFLARAMAHISSPSFVPPVPIEHSESVLLCLTAASKDSPLIIRVATEEDRKEPTPSRLLVKYPMVRSIGDVGHSWNRFPELFTAGLVSGLNESVAAGLRDNLGNPQAEDTASWIKAQGIGEEDPIIYKDRELSDEWWSEGQKASECENLWTRQLLAVEEKERASDGIEIP